MKKLLFTLLFVAASLSLARAQVIYEISGNGAAAKSYVFATNRLTNIQFLDSIPNLFKYFGRCNKVITEFSIADYEAIAALRQAALLPDSVQLKNYFTEDEYKQIDEALKLTLNMGLNKLGRMKPQYLTEMYRTELLKKWADYDENKSSEHFFEAVAMQTNKPIYGLDDTGETMYMMFDREPFHWQCSELKKVVEYPEREVKQEKIIRNLYQQGRLLDLSYQVSSPDNLTTVSYSDYKVYCARNKTWVKRLTPYLKQGNAFVCVNAIYVGGEEGLLALLKAAGFKVKPANKKTGY